MDLISVNPAHSVNPVNAVNAGSENQWEKDQNYVWDELRLGDWIGFVLFGLFSIEWIEDKDATTGDDRTTCHLVTFNRLNPFLNPSGAGLP